MGAYKDLDVWKLSVDFVVEVYKLTNNFPSDEKYTLVSQIRRSAISIPSNIAEGSGRKNVKEYIQFLHIALGSLSELETQLLISKRLDYLSEDYEGSLNQIRAKLLNLIKYLKGQI